MFHGLQQRVRHGEATVINLRGRPVISTGGRIVIAVTSPDQIGRFDVMSFASDGRPNVIPSGAGCLVPGVIHNVNWDD